MKKKMARAKLVPYKDGNPPRQTKGAGRAKPLMQIEITPRSRTENGEGEN